MFTNPGLKLKHSVVNTENIISTWCYMLSRSVACKENSQIHVSAHYL